MRKMNTILRYWNTIKYLKPVQIEHQIGKRLLKRKRKRLETSIAHLKAPLAQEICIVIPELDYNDEYLRRFCPELLLDNKVRLLHENHEINGQWEVPEASHLWNYNLHYLEFLIPLAVLYQRTGDKRYFHKWQEYVESWMYQTARDSMEPYTISLRVPNLLICLEIFKQEIKGTETEKRILDSIYRQYKFLLKNTELSLLANHYFENLKTIVICSVLFREEDVFNRHFAMLKKQIQEQILPDGVHFERSMMYHRIILEDLLRVLGVLDSAGYEADAASLISAICSMASAMEHIEKGFDTVPLFNDAGNNVAKDKKCLLTALKRMCKYESVYRADFPESGYYKLYSGDKSVLFDCGEIGPSYMSGHSHCDCLSFELSAAGHKIFSNSGTGQYQGTKRQFFRSTRAHNTFMIDEREQSELWGEHRAARRISKITTKIGNNGVSGQYRSYQGDLLRRSLRWNGNVLTVHDLAEVSADDKANHTLRQFFHLAPGYSYEDAGNLAYVKDADKTVAEIRIPECSRWLIHREGELTDYAEDFGQYFHKEVLEVQTCFSRRIQSRIDIRINSREETNYG